MKILILGGTKFLGRHLVEAALARGHEVTLFNRGKTNPHLYPAVEKICGDRDGNLDALKGRHWDAAIDTSGYVPAQVRASASLLANTVGHYTFISSISVYRDFSEAGLDENAPMAVLPSGAGDNGDNGQHYGANKAMCERTAERAMPGRVLIVRPGIIVGPHDPTNRFSHWVLRIARGGDILCPAPPEAPLQIIDARDLASWIIRMVEARQVGCFNAAGPANALTFQQMLDICKNASGSDARFAWADEEFLLEHKINPSTELPLWIPKTETAYAGFFAVDCGRALKMGLVFRPLAETVLDVFAFAHDSSNNARETGLSPGREAKILQDWNARIPA
jgi:2'-hydroxyisoflavone reductase